MSISQCAVLDALEWVKLSMQAGRLQCPSIASLSRASNHEDGGDDTDESELVRDMENMGITATLAKVHKDLILRFLETTVAQGELPFRDDSISVYSEPIGDYTDIVEQVNIWMGAGNFTYASASLKTNGTLAVPNMDGRRGDHYYELQSNNRDGCGRGNRYDDLQVSGGRVHAGSTHNTYTVTDYNKYYFNTTQEISSDKILLPENGQQPRPPSELWLNLQM
jgi:hypothetical protein